MSSMDREGGTGMSSPTVADPGHVTLLLTADEVARALRVGRSKVYELMRSGALPSVKIGGSRRVSVTALAEFVAALERDAA
jgi:excisionase family DNA binding protein